MSQVPELNISAFLKQKIEDFTVAPVAFVKGSVSTVGDGVVRVSGLPGRLYGELLEFDGGVMGMALDLDENGAGAVLFDSADVVKVGDGVRGTGAVAEIPVGDNVLGRVLDPIGRALDGAPFTPEKYYPVERPAPSVTDRRPVDKPLQTGILAIDSMIPIGRGQRELIIGDRQTGKTTIAVDSILNQRGSDVICVYCAVGQKASTVAQVVKTLEAGGAMAYTAIVAATAADSPAMQYLAPYSACSVAEYFMEQGRDVLIVYDDLSKHAVAYRTISLLLHRPPGREAYPGDVFYLHSRLLERSACLARRKGGGSLTALPIVETMENNIAAFIPTNVISITDGQIYLESELFHSGVRPAVNTGLSVSRVGRAAQTGAMKKVSGTLRIDLSQYREMAVFARFGSDVDPATKRLLDKGEGLVNLFKQGKSKPYSLSRQVMLLLAYSLDLFTGIGEKEFPAYLAEVLAYIDERCADLCAAIDRSGELPDDVRADAEERLKAFGKQA